LLPSVFKSDEVIPVRFKTPAEEKDEVAVPPKYAFVKTERSVEDAPPLKSIRDVVALCPAAGCVHAS
jgi:hypothetical protein